jgi:hypothetical protein
MDHDDDAPAISGGERVPVSDPRERHLEDIQARGLVLVHGCSRRAVRRDRMPL